uniref:DUF5801 repeats-in-toxin domain-containing protein n=1 Tax=Pseudomonas sp. OTU5201 TaxID=3043850 RepID=UPI00313C673A
VTSNGSYTYTLISAPKVNPDNNGSNLQFSETFTFTVTDANGNTGIGTLTIDIIDDVPSISVRGLDGLDLQVDETTLGATDSTNFAGAFAPVFGADGAALNNAVTYSLDVKSPGVDSGLRDTATGSSILLFKEGADIVGRVVGGGQLAFRLSVAADGTVTLDQSRAIFHTPNDGPDQAAGLAGADLITLNATITDGDGDQDSASLDLGNAISFKDDAPCIDPSVKVYLDDDALPYGNPGGVGDSDPDTRNTSGTIAHDFGADGPGSITLLTSGAPDGFSYEKDGDNLLIKQGGLTVITLALNWATGAYSVVQNNPIMHPAGYDENDVSFSIAYKVTDADGDGATGSLIINVDDDTPKAYADSASIIEGSVPATLSGNVLGNDFGGADQPKAFTSWNGVAGAIAGENGSLLVNTPYGVVTLNADGSYSFVLANGSAAVEGLDHGEQVTLQYAYSMRDADNDSSESTLTITITGSNDAPTVEVSTPDAEGDLAQVFEKGLAGGSSANDGSTVITGSFSVADSDGLASLKTLSVGSLTVDLTTSGFASLVGQSFTTDHGTVLITGYSNGTYSFSYTLTEATTDMAGMETDGFLVSVGDGLANASASVTVEIVDDLPQGNSDSRSLTENGSPSSVSGNVLDNDVGGADQPKAFASWNGVAGATPGDNDSLLVNTPYGVVTLNADGSYSFALANGSAAVEGLDQGEQVTLQYAYSMRDADNDPSSSTLTLTITGSNDIPTVDVSTPSTGGDLAKVYEKGLAGGSSAGDGSNITTGSFTVADADGLANLKTLSVGSLTVDLTTSGFASLVGQSFTTDHGTVLITGYSNGAYSFSYTLTEATPDATGPETDGFLINVGDGLANASATVTIEIADDLPQAKADGASVSEGSSVNGNVVSGGGLGSVADVFGADGRPSPTTGVVGVRTGNDTSTPVSGDVGVPIDTGLGTLVLHADGSYTYTSHANSAGLAGAVDTFTYSIVDADGDLSTTTLTINVSNYTVVGSVQAGSDQDVREA